MPRIFLFLALSALLLGGCSRLPRPEGCPPASALRDFRPPEATRLFAMDGSRLADLSPERRVVVGLDEVPPVLTNGFIAVEDRRFWTHGGIDPRGVFRAAWVNLRTLSLREGSSTITMQLPRNVFPDLLPRRDRWRRKLCELRLAGEIEAELGKREVLRLYINQVYLGDGKYGVEEAARAYFGKSATRLTHAEAALLIGLVKNPEGNNPRRTPDRAIQRRNVVLGVLAREGVISEAEAEGARAEPLRLAPPQEASGPAPWYVAAVRRELRERFGDDADIRGLRVHTGLDPAVQRAARDALVEQIRALENGSLGRWPHPRPGEARMEPAEGSGSPYLQGAIVVLDTRTGEVRALVGGRDFTHSSFDRALAARRQPGSTFKPIVFAAALQQGLRTTDLIETTAVSVELDGTAWRPDDLVHDSITSLTVRQAMALSSNNAAVRIGERAGVGNVARMATTLGLTTPVPPLPSVFLGSAEVIPAEFAAAYATMGNGGRLVRPTLITRVEDARGNVLWQAPRQYPRVLDEGVAYLATSIMEDVVDRGTGTAVRREGFWHSAAGKTGTTNNARDVWFVGMTPDLTAAVWFGFDQPTRILNNAFGGNVAAPVWARVMRAAYANRPAPPAWTPPPSLISMPVDMTTGAAATDLCPPENIRVEFFLPGTEPAEYCPLHGGGDEGGVLDRLLRGLKLRGDG
jgi:penicillin-binding protein 1A